MWQLMIEIRKLMSEKVAQCTGIPVLKDTLFIGFSFLH